MASSERYKGHDQLIDALPAIRRRAPDTQLVFVGTGDDVERLRQRAHASGVGACVTFTGFLPDDGLQRAYREASVFAMPSRCEGFGLAYLEAMAAGLPCVGSVHDAASEVIDDGVTGYLVDQQNTDEIAARISSLLTEEDRRAEMGRRGRERWEREFTYEHFRRRLVAAFDAPFRALAARAPQPSSVTG
jgi:glycosyltransferase involved in cell wall biosynthesis